MNNSSTAIFHLLQYVRSLLHNQDVKNLKFSLKETITSYSKCNEYESIQKSIKPLKKPALSQ
ncbi:hypothetical protein I8751_14960 [Nostocaceae cyanobacterium CENA357]|uniref:Uncharacterized protein n=1 Tax=Atlanticothrix silvestris CENA357 TaxID=1725252 RepID=A0A8J7HF36_9CYAN|nr:hypothetical protein [Atlanticothrix silvestris CENA357]